MATVDGVTGLSSTGFVYGAFGEVVEKAGTTAMLASHHRRWNDKYVDDESGLAYYGARYYDNVALAWTQGDPLFRWAPDFAGGDPRRANLYVFSLQNPLKLLDPDGLEPQREMTIARRDMSSNQGYARAEKMAKASIDRVSLGTVRLGATLSQAGVTRLRHNISTGESNPNRARTIEFTLLDMSSDKSKTNAVAQSPALQEAVQVLEGDTAVGYSPIGQGHATIAIDRVSAKIEGKSDKEAQEIVDADVDHEGLHAAGAQHSKMSNTDIMMPILDPDKTNLAALIVLPSTKAQVKKNVDADYGKKKKQ